MLILYYKNSFCLFVLEASQNDFREVSFKKKELHMDILVLVKAKTSCYKYKVYNTFIFTMFRKANISSGTFLCRHKKEYFRRGGGR